MNPLMSVIITIQKNQDAIIACLESLIHQTVNKNQLEIIIIDGESSGRVQNDVDNYILYHPEIKVYYQKIHTDNISEAR